MQPESHLGDMMRSTIAFLAAGLMLASAPTAEARTFKDITDPYFAKYGDWKKVRKAMRQRQKGGEQFTADDWFVLAAMCAIEPPKGPSKIMNLAQRSPCKGQVIEYFERAGDMGAPRGFNQASYYARTRENDPVRAWYFAQLAYRMAGTDSDLAADALERLSEVRISSADEQRMQAQVEGAARRLAANGVYAASAARAAVASGPSLDWLDFVDGSKCYWSDDANLVFSMGHKFDARGDRAIPATLRIPNSSRTVTSRVERRVRANPNLVDVEVDFPGRWNGLTLVGTTRRFIERSDAVNSFGLRFREPVGEVAARLRAAGLPVNADGSEKVSTDRRVERWAGPDGGGSETYIEETRTSVFRRGNETVFYCNFSSDNP